MSDQNGIRQTPFSEAWPTPGTEGQGANGIGGGLDAGSGGNGIVSSPWSNPVVPTPGGEATGDSLGSRPAFVQLDGGSEGPGAGIVESRNTIDKK